MATIPKLQTRIRPKNILYCTDFSDAAVHALPYAADLARHFGSKLWAMHVRMGEAEGTEVSNLEPLDRAQAEERLRNLLEPFGDISQSVLAPEGPIWPSVEKAIEEQKIDLLVIGTRGRTGVRKLLLGSWAEEMFRRARCAVLTVGPHAPSTPAGKHEISEIVYATDFDSHSQSAAAYAVSLAQEYQTRLVLLHVMPEPKDGDLRVVIDELERAAERRLRELVPPGSELWCEPRAIVAEGLVPDEILKVASDYHAGLIVLGVHRPDGFPGTHLPIATAHKIVSHATCPVLTVRD